MSSEPGEGNQMRKFRKKPVVIEAVQFDGTRNGIDAIEDFMGKPCGHNFIGGDPGHFEMWIETLEGGHKASPGDWIIRGVKGEFYPCKPDIFAATYEAVES